LAGDAHRPLLERLPQRVERAGRELAELVEEQDAPMWQCALCSLYRDGERTPMTTTKPRACLYTRISRDTAGEGLGVRRQERILRALAKSVGADVANVETDNDVSATSAKVRPGWRRMLAGVTRDEYDLIIALDSDRLLRKPGDLEELFTLAEKHRVRVMFEHGGFDPVSGEGMLEARIRAAVDAEEVRKLKTRVARKNQELVEAGKMTSGGGDRPFGYQSDRRTLDADEAPVVAELVSRLLAGDSIRGCCADLNARGITTTTGGGWSPTTMRRLVTSARIAGLIEREDTFYPATEWPAIISCEDLVELRAKLNDPLRRTRHSASEYLLTGGLAQCGLCGAALVARPNDRKQPRYVCAKGVGLKGCGKIMRLAEPVDAFVTEAVFTTIDHEDFAAILAARQRHDEAASARDTVTVLQAKLADLAEAWANERITKAEWDAARAPLAARLEAAEAAAEAVSTTRAVDAYVGHPGALRVAWADLGHDRRRDIVASLLRSLTILPNPTPGNNRFNPDLLVPDWRY
jgi:site-specific DNA recombinase